MKLQEKNEAACFFPLCPTFQTTPDSNRLGLHCSLLFSTIFISLSQSAHSAWEAHKDNRTARTT